MKGNLSHFDISNQISMMRSTHDGMVIVVEGNTDYRFYRKFIDKGQVEIVVAHSKDNVRKSITEVWGRRGDHRVIGIMDPDLDRLCNKQCRPPLFLTDKRDLEAMILSSNALEDVLVEYGDESLIEEFERSFGSIRDVLAHAGSIVGAMMFVSKRDGLGLSFKDINYFTVLDRRSLAIGMSELIDEIFLNSFSPKIGKGELKERVIFELRNIDDEWEVARGHDVVSMLLVGLMHTFGGYNSRSLKEGQLSGALRLAYGFEHFKSTNLYRDSGRWAMSKSIVLWITQ